LLFKWGGYESTNQTVSCRAPQGSVVGPILILIDVTDMANASKSSSKIRLSADDTNIFLFHNDLGTLYNNFNNVLDHVSDWMLVNKLSINIHKKIILYSHPIE